MTQIRIFDEEYDTTQKQLTIYNKTIDLKPSILQHLNFSPSIWQMTQLSELILVSCKETKSQSLFVCFIKFFFHKF